MCAEPQTLVNVEINEHTTVFNFVWNSHVGNKHILMKFKALRQPKSHVNKLSQLPRKRFFSCTIIFRYYMVNF